MCQRTCPKCGSTKHNEGFGVTGLYIVCDQCDTILAVCPDPAAAPLDRDPDEWAREGRFVIPGAEAVDPADDQIFKP
jgi:hypothetical protein